MAGLQDIDVNQPDANATVPDLPVRQRETRQAVVASFEKQHHLNGEHKIDVGDTNSRPGPAKEKQIYYNTDEQEIQYTESLAWKNLGFFTKKVAQGKYTGDGTASQSITGVGFQPDILLVFPITGTKAVYIKIANHAGVNSTIIGSGTISVEGIQTLDSDGFTTGNEINDNAQQYGFVALKTL